MKVLAIVKTEYHLMLLINRILSSPSEIFDVYLSKRDDGKRLNLEFDFTDLSNATFNVLNTSVDLKSKIISDQRDFLNHLAKESFKEFIFFQQQDAFTLAILRHIRKEHKNCLISLYQDGLKPYNDLKGFSLSMIKNDLLVSKWLKNNGFRGFSLFEFINSKRYAYNKEIDNVYLTFPLVYNNWNNKEVKRIDFMNHIVFRSSLEKVFKWKNDFLKNENGGIFYLTQPTHSSGVEECRFLLKLMNTLKKPAIIKLHPLTSEEQENNFRSISKNVEIIKSSIPAEIFIMNLTNCVCVALNSTSFFYNTPGNRYYYTAKLFEKDIPRLKRYNMINNISPHIKLVSNIDEII